MPARAVCVSLEPIRPKRNRFALPGDEKSRIASAYWTDPPGRDSVSAIYHHDTGVLLAIGGNGDICGGDCSDLWSYGGP